MPPAAKRNASIILYDVKTNSDFAVEAKKCLLNICAMKWFTDTKDSTRLILVNTKETKNYIYDNFKQAEHINEVTDEIGYNPKIIEDNILNVETAEGDWIVALAVGLQAIKDNFVKQKLVNIQLLFITDLSIPVESKLKRFDFIVEKLNEMNVFLYIVGPKVKVPSVLKSFKHVEEWSRNIEFCEENPNFQGAAYIVKHAKHAVICDLKLGEHLFQGYLNGTGLQPWKVPLTVGSGLTMHTDAIRFLRKAKIGQWRESEQTENDWAWHLSEDVLSEVPFHNVIGGFYAHQHFVPLPDDVEKDLKFNQQRCFKIIAFTDRANVIDVYLAGDGASVITSDTSRSFKLLVSVLKKHNKCAIGYRVYMFNTRPKLFALFPESDSYNLIMVELVYGNKARWGVKNDISETPLLVTSSPTVMAMYEYLEKIDVTNAQNKDENGSVKLPLAPHLMVSPNLQLTTDRCLQKYSGVNAVDFNRVKIVLPDFGDHHQKYTQYFPVRAVPQASQNIVEPQT